MNLVLSLPWIRLKPTTKLPQNSQYDPDEGPTISLLWIWTHTHPMKQLTTQIEKERGESRNAMVLTEKKQKIKYWLAN